MGNEAEDAKFVKLMRQGIARDFKAMKKQSHTLNIGEKSLEMGPLEGPFVERGHPDSRIIRNITRKGQRSALKGLLLDREMRAGKIALIENEMQQFGRTVIRGLPVVALGADLVGRIRKARKEKKAQ